MSGERSAFDLRATGIGALFVAIFVAFGGGERPKPAEPSAAEDTLEEVGAPSGPPSVEAPPEPKLIEEFFAETSKEEKGKTCFTALVATIPDPLEPALAESYDSDLMAIQRALGAAGYLLDGFDLPWEGQRKLTGPRTKIEKRVLGLLEAFNVPPDTDAPGEILFRRNRTPSESPCARSGPPCAAHTPEPKPTVSTREVPKRELLTVYLVPESPTRGVKKRTLRRALERASQVVAKSEHYCAASNLGEGNSVEAGALPILGPRYSGSAGSLRRTIEAWQVGDIEESPESKSRRRPVRILSGSATALDCFRGTTKVSCRELGDLLPSMMLVHDEYRLAALSKFVELNRSGRTEAIALMVEGSSEYGSNASRLAGPSKEDTPRSAGDGLEQVVMTYPMQLARLRALAVGDSRVSRGELIDFVPRPITSARQAVTKDASYLPQVLSDSYVVDAELELRQQLAGLARAKIHHVVLLASIRQDALFLAQEVRRHSPNTVVILLEPDLLYSHSDAAPFLRGAWTLSSFPLHLLSQELAERTARAGRSASRQVFHSEAAQGIFNAVLSLVRFHRLTIDQTRPVGAATCPWLSLVGRESVWPVRRLPTSERGSVAPCREAIPEVSVRRARLGTGLLTTLLLVAALAAFSWWLWRSREAGESAEWELAASALLASALAVWFGIGLQYSYFASEATSFIDGLTLVEIAVLLGGLLVVVASVWRLPSRTASVRELLAFSGGKKDSLSVEVRHCARAWMLAGPAISVLAAILIWVVCSGSTDPLETAFLWLRASSFASGVSPVLPILVGLAAVAILTSARVDRWRRRDLHSIVMTTDASELVSLWRTPPGDAVRRELCAQGTVRRNWLGVHLLILVAAIFYWLQFWVPTIETRGYDVALVLLFSLAGSMCAVQTARTLAFWLTIRSLLGRLDRELGEACWKRAAESGRFDFSLSQTLRRPQVRALRAVLQAVERGVLLHTFDQDDRLRWEAIRMEADSALSEASKAYESRSPSRERLRQGADLAVSRAVAFVEAVRGPKSTSSGARRDFVANASSHYSASVLQGVVGIVTSQMVYLATCVALLLLATAAYPLPSSDYLARLNWFLALGVAASFAVISIQMERDPVLSRLSATAPGKISLNRTFIGRFGIAVFLPLLSAVGSQGNELMERLFELLQRVLGGS